MLAINNTKTNYYISKELAPLQIKVLERVLERMSNTNSAYSKPIDSYSIRELYRIFDLHKMPSNKELTKLYTELKEFIASHNLH